MRAQREGQDRTAERTHPHSAGRELHANWVLCFYPEAERWPTIAPKGPAAEACPAHLGCGRTSLQGAQPLSQEGRSRGALLQAQGPPEMKPEVPRVARGAWVKPASWSGRCPSGPVTRPVGRRPWGLKAQPRPVKRGIAATSGARSAPQAPGAACCAGPPGCRAVRCATRAPVRGVPRGPRRRQKGTAFSFPSGSMFRSAERKVRSHRFRRKPRAQVLFF